MMTSEAGMRSITMCIRLNGKEQEMIKTYIKRPVKIQAIQYTGENLQECKSFCGENIKSFLQQTQLIVNILTLEGRMTVSLGDYIIQGIAGEYYPCKPDIFEKTYEIKEDEK